MRSKPNILASNSDNNNDLEQNVGLSMVDILTLSSPQQQQIINWIMRHRNSSLEAIAIGIEANPADTLPEIEDLISQGFLEVSDHQGVNYYTIDFGHPQSIPNKERMPSASGELRPLSIILNPSGTVSISTGDNFELCVTVTNQGDRSAVITVDIDQDSSSIYAWCAAPSERLALSVGQSSEVVFSIQVPPTAPPKEYSYTIIIDAPQHYPEDTPIQYKGRVIVTPSTQEIVRVNDPTFATIPRTTSSNPHQMRTGEIWQILISVNNRSDRVDRFRVTLPDLDPKWVSIYYPEGLALVGIVEATEGLPLNPNTQGQINLILKPPMDVWAGIYSPTVRVHSENNPDLALLDIVYFEILPSYQLDIQLVTLLTRIANLPSLYEMRFKSSSNIAREIVVRASSPEQEGLLTYSFNVEETKIAPYGSTRINLEVLPTKKCTPRFLSDRYLNFIVEVEDKQGITLTSDRYIGNLLLPARPWWQFALVIISILGIIGTVIFLIWWIFFRPAEVPVVVEFTSESTNYREVSNEAIRLRWRITNPELVKEIKVEGFSEDQTTLSQPVVYNFSKGIPSELKEYCIIDRELLCQNVPTDARKPSQYIFQMNLASKNPKTGILPLAKTSKITVEPIPQAQILEFASNKPVYTESKPVLPTLAPPSIAKTNQKKLDNAPTSKPSPPTTTNNSANKQPNNSSANSPSPEFVAAKTKETIFISEVLEKRVFFTALGIAESPANLRLVKPKPDLDNEVRLNWRLSNVSQIKELTLVGRSPEGEIKSPPLKYLLTKGIPRSLRPYCTISNDEMICKNIPTEAKASGNYIFELAITPLKPPIDPKAGPVIRKTEIVKILPYPAKILELKVNGQEALPQYSFNLNPDIPTILILTWKVEASAAAKIDLLPAPGNVAAIGQLFLPLSPKSAEVTYTLKVTNPDGQIVMRSFIVQTIAPPPVPKSEGTPPIALPPEIPAIDSPLIPASPNQRSGGSLSPSELRPSQR
jgi:hypothetical protein